MTGCICRRLMKNKGAISNATFLFCSPKTFASTGNGSSSSEPPSTGLASENMVKLTGKESNKSETAPTDLYPFIENDSKLKSEDVIPAKGPPPEVPTTCCRSGCPTCVWIEYAEELANYYKDGGEKAIDAISQMDDPNLKAFLLMELKFMKR